MGKDTKAAKSSRSKDEAKGASTARREEKKAGKKERAKAGKKQRTKGTSPSSSKGSASTPADVLGSFREALRVAPGTALTEIDTRSTPAYDGDKDGAADLLSELAAEVSELQERLYAEGSAGGRRSLLLVIQGMDTSGKGGIMRHVVGAMDPQGVALTAFKAPTAEERSHPFLWRIRKALPAPGYVGVFDRSHYEDVLIVRVHDLVPRVQWSRRYGQINTFERRLVESGTTVIKVMLHVSEAEQGERLTERLARPDKHWKFATGDLDEREHWSDYQEAYQAVIDRCSSDEAPWYVVPADRKWYARLAVMSLVREHLAAMDPQWPEADFDVAAAQERLAAQISASEG